MLECKKCDYNCNGQICKITNKQIPKIGCDAGKERPATNYYNIQNMSIEEMTIFIINVMEHTVEETVKQLANAYPGIENTKFDKTGTYENINKWLQQEA